MVGRFEVLAGIMNCSMMEPGEESAFFRASGDYPENECTHCGADGVISSDVILLHEGRTGGIQNHNCMKNSELLILFDFHIYTE